MAAIIALNPRTRELHKLSVFNSRRARRFRTPGNPDTYLCARRKCVHRRSALVPRGSSAEFGPAANPLPNAIAGKLGQWIQTQAAMHAARVVFIDWLQSGDAMYWLTKSLSPTKRPRANVPCGSNAFLTRCPRSVVPSAVPTHPVRAFQSLGQNNIEGVELHLTRAEIQHSSKNMPACLSAASSPSRGQQH